MTTADTTTTTTTDQAAPATAAAPTDQAPPPTTEQAPPATAQEPHPNAPPPERQAEPSQAHAGQGHAQPAGGPSQGSGAPAAAMPQTRGTPASALRGPLPLEPRDADDLWRYAQMIKDSNLIKSRDVRGSAASVMHLLLLGHTLGLPIHMSLAIHVIEGNPSLPAQTILAICKKSPFCKAFTLLESTLDRAVFRAVRRDPTTGEIVEDVTMAFTAEEAAPLMARAQKNIDKSAWAVQPMVMMQWRCVTRLARVVFPDVIGGLYSTEELRDTLEVDSAGGVQTVTVAASEVDGAKPGGIEYRPSSVAIGALPPPGRDPMDAAFSEVTDRTRPAREAEPVPAGRGSTSSRLADRAAQARGGGRGGPPGYNGPTCPACGGPVQRAGQTCAACANQ